MICGFHPPLGISPSTDFCPSLLLFPASAPETFSKAIASRSFTQKAGACIFMTTGRAVTLPQYALNTTTTTMLMKGKEKLVTVRMGEGNKIIYPFFVFALWLQEKVWKDILQ